MGGLHIPVAGSQRWQSGCGHMVKVLGTQRPAVQASPLVHRFMSEQSMPSLVATHSPLAGSQRWQSGTAQDCAGPGVQVPEPLQMSPFVHLLPSSQGVGRGLGVPVQVPVAGLHWRQVVMSHITGLAPWQTPARHLSTMVHLLPSSQLAPSPSGA
jgi:hypothetical protein